MRYLTICLMLSVAGCAHPIYHHTNDSHTVSYDGNVKNGGIVSIDPSGGRIVTDSFRARYNSLVDMYGDQMQPALTPDAGLVNLAPNKWLIDKEHFIKALQMSQWKRDGRQPTGTVKKLINKLT